MTAFTRSGNSDFFEKAESDEVTVATTIEMDEAVSDGMTHCFVGIQQFDVGGLPDVASAGTYAIQVKTLNTEEWETVADSPIDATAPVTLNFAANVSSIRAVPTGITGDPVTYKLVLTANRR